jgi:hypothetical protein
MLNSFGYDSLILRHVSNNELIQALYHGLPIRFLDKDNFRVVTPEIRFKWERGSFYLALNLPKLLPDGHNLFLCNHVGAREAIERAERTINVELRDWDVNRIDICYTGELPGSFDRWASLLRRPNASDVVPYSGSVYFNAAEHTWVAYDKEQHMRDSLRRVPYRLSDNHTLFRLEFRALTKVRRQLGSRGLWTHHSLRAQDLCTEQGFKALGQLYEQRLRAILPVRDERQMPFQDRKAYLKSLRRQISDRFHAQMMKQVRLDVVEGNVEPQIADEVLRELRGIRREYRSKRLIRRIRDAIDAASEAAD